MTTTIYINDNLDNKDNFLPTTQLRLRSEKKLFKLSKLSLK